MAGDNRLIAVVKADAYGHGALEVTRTRCPMPTLLRSPRWGRLSRYVKQELNKKYWLWAGLSAVGELQTCIDHAVDPVLHHQFHLDSLRDHPNLNDLDVWLKVDSGMGRLGISAAKRASRLSVA